MTDPLDGPAGHDLARAEGALEACNVASVHINRLPWWAWLRRRAIAAVWRDLTMLGHEFSARSAEIDDAPTEPRRSPRRDAAARMRATLSRGLG